MIRMSPAPLACVLLTAFVTAQEAVTPELQSLVDAERAFAKAATVKGIRDSFLEFFADDAIAFGPAPVPAKDRLRAQKPQPFSVAELTWEPRTGDVAASGELGWLTGPSTFVDRSAAEPRPRYGNYLSVWRKQPDGQWRVFIDVGANTPQAVDFAPGFVRFPMPTRYHGAEGKAAATRVLTDADGALNARLAKGTAAAYAGVLTPASRLHRAGSMTVIGAQPIANWLGGNASTMTATTTTAEASNSGDFGYSYGLYEIAAPAAQTGAYVRVWTRDGGGTWWIVADVSQPVRP